MIADPSLSADLNECSLYLISAIFKVSFRVYTVVTPGPSDDTNRLKWDCKNIMGCAQPEREHIITLISSKGRKRTGYRAGNTEDVEDIDVLSVVLKSDATVAGDIPFVSQIKTVIKTYLQH
jgi:hypothetical protein